MGKEESLKGIRNELQKMKIRKRRWKEEKRKIKNRLSY